MGIMGINAAAPTDTRVRNAATAAAGAGAIVATVPLLGAAMFATAPYGRSWGSHALRTAAPYVGTFAVPAAVGAGASVLAGGGGAGIAAGAASGGAVGAAIGATLLYGSLGGGSSGMSRVAAAGLSAIVGIMMGGLSGAIAGRPPAA